MSGMRKRKNRDKNDYQDRFEGGGGEKRPFTRFVFIVICSMA